MKHTILGIVHYTIKTNGIVYNYTLVHIGNFDIVIDLSSNYVNIIANMLKCFQIVYIIIRILFIIL